MSISANPTNIDAAPRIALARSILNHREPTVWTARLAQLALQGAALEELTALDKQYAGDK